MYLVEVVLCSSPVVGDRSELSRGLRLSYLLHGLLVCSLYLYFLYFVGA